MTNEQRIAGLNSLDKQHLVELTMEVFGMLFNRMDASRREEKGFADKGEYQRAADARQRYAAMADLVIAAEDVIKHYYFEHGKKIEQATK